MDYKGFEELVSSEEYRNLPKMHYPEIYGDLEYFKHCMNLTDLADLRSFLEKMEILQEKVLDILEERNREFKLINAGLRLKIRDGIIPSMYGLTHENLAALSENELLFLLCYPFFFRMGGSFEVEFALKGELALYMEAYKERIPCQNY